MLTAARRHSSTDDPFVTPPMYPPTALSQAQLSSRVGDRPLPYTNVTVHCAVVEPVHETVPNTPHNRTDSQANTGPTGDGLTPRRLATSQHQEEFNRGTQEFHGHIHAMTEEIASLGNSQPTIETIFSSSPLVQSSQEPDAWKKGHLDRLRHDDRLQCLNRIGDTRAPHSPIDRALISVLENLEAYKDESTNGLKVRDYFTRHYVTPKPHQVDNSATGGNSFFGEDHGTVPQRICHDVRYHTPAAIDSERRPARVVPMATRTYTQF
jgi:hypothetical protein